MRIACPACAAAYDVPDRLLAGAGRTLRCSRCGADFPLPGAAATEPPAAPMAAPVAAAAPPPPEPEPVPDAAPSDAPMAEAQAPPLRVPKRPLVSADPRPPPSLARAWAVSVAVVLGAVLALLVFRGRVMEAWPPATRLFAALGLD